MYTLSVQAVIVTKDEDFAERASRTINSPIIVWLRIGNATNPALLKWLQPRWSQVLMLLEEGHRLIQVR